MLKLVLVLVVGALLVSCLGKPSADTANADVTAFSDDFERSTLSEDAKLFEDSSKIPVLQKIAENRNATTDTLLGPDEYSRTGHDETVTKEAEDTDSSRNTEVESEIKNVTVEKNRTGESRNIDKNRKENTDEMSQKREADPTKLDNYDDIGQSEKNKRRLLLGFSLDKDKDADVTEESNIKSFNGESRRSNDRTSLESELNVIESLTTQTGNIEKNSAETFKSNLKSVTEKSEVGVDVHSSRGRKVNAVQENDLEDDIHDTTISSDTRSAKPTTIELETTSVLQNAKEDQALVKNSERSVIPENVGNLDAVHPNFKINRKNSARSATPSDTKLDTDATSKSGYKSVKPPVAKTPADETKCSKKLEETNAENRNGNETTANAECSSDKALQLAPELKTEQKSKIDEVVEETNSNGATKRMIADDKHNEGVDVAAVTEVAKDAVSRAGSPADQSRIASPSHAPLSLPTTAPVPMRRSISTQPSIIITRIPNSDIVKLPHELGVAASSLVPNNLSRRGVDFTIGLNASENSFTFDGNERTSESAAKSTDQSINDEYNSPGSVLRVDKHSNDFNNYDFKAYVGSPVDNPDVRHDNQKLESHLANEALQFEHSHRAAEALNSVSETSSIAAEETSNEEVRSAVEASMRNDANSYPLSLQPKNHFPIPEPFEGSLPEKKTQIYIQ